jgi:hypothetical protein
MAEQTTEEWRQFARRLRHGTHGMFPSEREAQAATLEVLCDILDHLRSTAPVKGAPALEAALEAGRLHGAQAPHW